MASIAQRSSRATCDSRFRKSRVDGYWSGPVPGLPAVLHGDALGLVVGDEGERVRVGVVAQPGEIEAYAVVGAGAERELPPDRPLVGPLYVVVPGDHVGGRAPGVAVLDGQARGENVVHQFGVLHELDAPRAEPAPFETEPAVVAVEGRLVVVDEHRADQRVGSLQGRLGAAQDLHRADVEERTGFR